MSPLKVHLAVEFVDSPFPFPQREQTSLESV